jgi:opine dehydrogenase
MKVAILGAGSGGQAMAADLTLAGHEVSLAAIPEHSTAISVIQTCGGIYVDGTTSGTHKTGFAKIALVTTDIKAAIKDTEVIMVVIPAFGQEAYMLEIIKYAIEGQIVVFNPGKFASLVFTKMLKKAGREGELIVGETASLIYAAKPRKFDQIYIKAVKSELMFSALPASNTQKALIKLNQLFPQFIPGDNIFATSIDDTSLALHTVSTILNTSRIELMGPYRNSFYDVTPSVGRVIDAMDKERITVSRAFGNFSIPFILILRFRYNAIGNNSYEALKQVSAYQYQISPDGLSHRYISEEVPYGLVPLTEIAKVIGIPTPCMNSIIEIASAANGQNYRENGRTLEKMGLAGMNLNDIINLIAPDFEGYYPNGQFNNK